MSISTTHEEQSELAGAQPPHPLFLKPPVRIGRAGWALALLGVIALIAVWLAPVDRLPSLCFTRRTFGVGCPTCGMTRALHALLHGEIALSWRYHPLLIVYLLCAAVWYAVRARRLSKGLGEMKLIWKSLAAAAALTLLIGVWIVRLLAGTVP